MTGYPKRLIEVDLPIKRISAHARREKSIRHGHISTLHIWWARRPLAACRAVICAALWPDPADPLCPDSFRETARAWVRKWATEHLGLLSAESYEQFVTIQKKPENLNDNEELRRALLDFIADFSNWDSSTKREYLETSRALTQAAHEALGGTPSTRPLVVDPFAGGGSIPLEALRVGADAFASDLNPVAVLLNKVVLEYVPKYGQRLADEVHKWSQWIKKQAEKELAELYPKDPDGATPIAYLWARTIMCEGPKCGYVLPLIRTLTLSSDFHLEFLEESENKRFRLLAERGAKAPQSPTVKGGAATCPKCNYTVAAKAVKNQLIAKNGGAIDAQLIAVYVESPTGRYFRSPTQHDEKAVKKAHDLYLALKDRLPSDTINNIRPYKNTRGLSAVTRVGINRFRDLYTPRQTICIRAFQHAVTRLVNEFAGEMTDLRLATTTVIGLAVGRLLHQNCSLSRWQNSRSTIAGTFSKQALQITWDFAESAPISCGSGSWEGSIEWILRFIEANLDIQNSGTVAWSSAKECPLPNNSACAVITDPPYFAAIPYADLAGFFYVWLRDIFDTIYPELFATRMLDQSQEAIVTNANRGPSNEPKDESFYKREMTFSLIKSRRILEPGGIALIVFADASTDGWESILSAVVDSGLVITASWPIDTELQDRTQARDAASLQSSVHLVCRPRVGSDSSHAGSHIGDWRDVLHELPKRIHEWMPRLASEGIVGADAIFACLGPALEIFSCYSRVEKASGEQVTLKEYLEYVWSAVAKEALSMIFEGGDATGFEEDARLTAMWLWTLSTGKNGSSNKIAVTGEDEEDEGEETPSKTVKMSGYVLEYDAARKIAQGLGAHLEQLASLVEIKGDKARLLPVSERTRYLFGKDAGKAPTKRKKKNIQLTFFDVASQIEEEGGGWGEKSAPKLGDTVLDRVHQSMILFAAGRSEALKRFLVEDGVGRDQRFWGLAQALSALYPVHTDEKRWVDGVLARKKGLGF